MTIAGQHTVAEVKELRQQKQSDIDGYNNAYIRAIDAWKQSDPIVAKDWEIDWQKFLTRWRVAMLKVEAILTGIAAMPGQFLIPDSALPAEPAYDIILEALQKTPGHFQKGDFPDLIQRWMKAQLPDPALITRQPEAFDVDLEAFKKADKATKTIESTASNPYLWAAAGVGGLLAWLHFSRRG